MNLILIFAAAFLLRLFALNQSFWLDEGTTAQVIRKFGFPEIITQFSPTDFHPPFYYLFLKVWASVFGYSEVSLRLPSVIFSLIAGYFIYKTARLLKLKGSIWSAIFFLFNPLIIYYSQEARMYLMVTCFLTIVLYYYFQSISGAKQSRHFIVDIFIFLSLVTFYGSILFIGTLIIHALITRKFSRLSLLLPSTIAALFILSPLLFRQLENARSMLHFVPNWSLVLGQVNPKNILLIPLKFSVGRIQWEPKRIYYLIGGVWSLAVFGAAFFGAKKYRSLGMLFVMPIILGVLISFFTPLLQYFRFLYLIPLLSLLMAAGVGKTRYRFLLLLFLLVFSAVYLFNSDYHREDWRKLASSIPDRSDVYMVFTSSDPLQYYFNRQKKNGIRIIDLSRIEERLDDKKELIIIPYTSDIHGQDYRKLLENKGFTKVRQQDVRGLSIEWWGKYSIALNDGWASYGIR